MANEGGTWIMHGLDWDDPRRVKSWEELIALVDEVGFLPLFQNEIPGFSVEEHTSPLFWWTDDPAQDPWAWRTFIARSGRVAYGKFFGKRAGFLSKAWFPRFANWRRDGYDFDSRWDEELANRRSKRLMDQFSAREAWFSYQLKQAAGFGKEGEKNFEGAVTDLQMQTYLVIRDFQQRVNKKGQPYGWPISVYTTPEALWGYDYVTSAYRERPESSRQAVLDQVRARFPEATEDGLKKVLLTR